MHCGFIADIDGVPLWARLSQQIQISLFVRVVRESNWQGTIVPEKYIQGPWSKLASVNEDNAIFNLMERESSPRLLVAEDHPSERIGWRMIRRDDL
jgi:hypothetical protein